MLRSLKDLENFSIAATDGPIGQVKDFYFDDDAWAIRYLVVATGSWLDSRQVLISPIAIHQPDWAGRTLPVSLTQAQVSHCPGIDTDRPVSRQQVTDHLGHYGYPVYWGSRGLWGEGLYPNALRPGFAGHGIDGIDGIDGAERQREQAAFAQAWQARHRQDDPHLRNGKSVIGHHIQAIDGEIGHVDGLLVDQETWAIRYLVANISSWWVGHQVLVAPRWITGVHWSDQSVSVDLTRAAIQQAPPYNTGAELKRQREMGRYDHHGRNGHWADGVRIEPRA